MAAAADPSERPAAAAAAAAAAADNPASLIGRRVRKYFEDPGGWFGGRVASYSSRYKWFRVAYDDGDAEELDLSELLPLLDGGGAGGGGPGNGGKPAPPQLHVQPPAAGVKKRPEPRGSSSSPSGADLASPQDQGKASKRPRQQPPPAAAGSKPRPAPAAGGGDRAAAAAGGGDAAARVAASKGPNFARKSSSGVVPRLMQAAAPAAPAAPAVPAAGSAVAGEGAGKTARGLKQRKRPLPEEGSARGGAPQQEQQQEQEQEQQREGKKSKRAKAAAGAAAQGHAKKGKQAPRRQEEGRQEQQQREGGEGEEGCEAEAGGPQPPQPAQPLQPAQPRRAPPRGGGSAAAGAAASGSAKIKAKAAAAKPKAAKSKAGDSNAAKPKAAKPKAAKSQAPAKKKGKGAATNAPPASDGLGEGLLEEVFGGEEPEWMADGDALETRAFESEEELKAHLKAAEKEHPEGEEPYRRLGLPVNLDEAAGGEDAARAVATAHDEFYREWRLGVTSENARVAQELQRRKEEDAERKAAGLPPLKRTALSRRPDRVAESIMLGKGDKPVRAVNQKHTFGHVPGITVGFKAFLRSEALVVGLHRSPLGGIVAVPAKDVKRMTGGKLDVSVVSSVVVSGSYEDDSDGIDELVYTGAGGNDLLGKRRQETDQFLRDENRALLANIALGVPVRVTRKNVDAKSFAGAIFVYDGLYNVVSYVKSKGIGGFVVWRYLLKRRGGQPESICKPTHFGLGFGGGVISAAPDASLKNRPNVVCKDLSKGKERLPVVVVNEVDRELPPGIDPDADAEWILDDRPEDGPLVAAPYPMRYITAYEYAEGVEPPQPPEAPDDEDLEPHEWLTLLNRGPLPYTEVTMRGQPVVAARDVLSVVVECGDWTGCTDPACMQRAAQHGLQHRLEVFKTRNRGWGVRSWDTIPCGALVAVFYGTVFRHELAGTAPFDDDTYFFDCCPRLDFTDDHRALPGGTHRTDLVSEFTIDAKRAGGVARFINHSCSPNLYVQPICVGHADRRACGIALFAAMPIPAWTELTYDYGAQYMHNNDDMDAGCHCGAACCRKPSGGGGAARGE